MPEVPQVPQVPEMPRVLEQERETTRTAEPQVTPSTSGRAEEGEINLEREPVQELSPETEKTDSYQHYVMTGKGETLKQKVNEAVKDLNYHNMLVVIAVRDKTINNIGSIYAVAGKWGLSYSIVQRAISGMKEHCQGGRQYNKITRCLQRRSRCKQDEPQAQDESDQEAPPIKKSKAGKGKSSRKTSGKRFKKRKQRMIAVAVMSYPTYHFKG